MKLTKDLALFSLSLTLSLVPSYFTNIASIAAQEIEEVSDCDGDGTPDEYEVAGEECGAPDEPDCDGDGTPDSQENYGEECGISDCDADGTPDGEEVAGEECGTIERTVNTYFSCRTTCYKQNMFYDDENDSDDPHVYKHSTTYTSCSDSSANAESESDIVCQDADYEGSENTSCSASSPIQECQP